MARFFYFLRIGNNSSVSLMVIIIHLIWMSISLSPRLRQFCMALLGCIRTPLDSLNKRLIPSILNQLQFRIKTAMDQKMITDSKETSPFFSACHVFKHEFYYQGYHLTCRRSMLIVLCKNCNCYFFNISQKIHLITVMN